MSSRTGLGLGGSLGRFIKTPSSRTEAGGECQAQKQEVVLLGRPAPSCESQRLNKPEHPSWGKLRQRWLVWPC